MALVPDRTNRILEGQNIRPPLGSFFNGQAYRLALYPEAGRSDRSVLVVRMVLQFQFSDGSGGSWTGSEKEAFAHGFVDNVIAAWADKFRITTTSSIPVRHARDVGVIFEFPYYIDGWHSDDDFELAITKVPSSAGWQVSTCAYSSGNTTLDSNDLRAETKGASMTQCDAVHEFGHMLGLRDEYPAANDNPNHTGDSDSMMNVGQAVRQRHYAPFAAWLSEKYAVAAHLSRSEINYKVEGTTDMSNAGL
jgi:hypothetical protein